MNACREISAGEMRLLAERIGERPQTAIPLNDLIQGRGRAWIAGSLRNWTAAVVQTEMLPREPMAFGTDAEAAIAILAGIDGWTCVEASEVFARRMGERMSSDGTALNYRRCFYYALHGTLKSKRHPSVRLLDASDSHLFERADPILNLGEPTSLVVKRELLAGAVIDGEIVAKAGCYSLSRQYGDVGVATIEAYRRQGLATATATLVMENLLACGVTPVWSTREDNIASQQMALKLGLGQVEGTMYVCRSEVT
jgi:hypothetical protein